MNVYADLPAQRARQVVGDLLVLTWVIAWVLVGVAVHGVIAELAAPGRALESAGTSLRDGLTDVGGTMSDVPLVGDDLRAPFDSAAGAAGSVSDAGVEFQDGVADVALVAGVSTAAGPILLVGGLWSLLRLRFARQAGAARRLLDAEGGRDLLALRALARQPTSALTSVSTDPVGAWRRADADVVERLAALELRSSGVRLRPSR